jgi:hypothetical protein
MNGLRRIVAVSRIGFALVLAGGALSVTISAIDAAPAQAASAPTWASGLYTGTVPNEPFCYDLAVSGGAPLTAMSAGTAPSGFTNYQLENINLPAGTAQLCGTDTNAASSSTVTFAPTATNSGGSASASITDAQYGACTWTSSTGAEKTFDPVQDLDQTGSQSAFGAPITNGETVGTTSNYATCTDAYVPGLGAFTVNTANPMPSPSDSNPSASQGDLSSSNLELNKGCYGAVELSAQKSYSFGSGTSLTVPSPWVNGGNCAYGSLGSNSAGGNTDSFATCPPTQSDVNAGLVDCSITASSGTQSDSFNYSTDDLFFTSQPVPQQSTATLSAASAPAGSTVSVTGGTNWWGASGGAPNTGPYGDDQAGAMYPVAAPSVYVGTTRSSAVLATSSLAVSGNTYACTGAESSSVGPNPCVFTAGSPSGTFVVPSGLSPGTYNVYIDEPNTTPLPGNGPSDAYQTARGTNLGTAESVTTLHVATPPAITSANSTVFVQGVAGSFTVQTTGAPTAAISESGSLPSGVSFVDNNNGTATLSGTTSSIGSYPITITAANGASPNATQNFTLTVNPPNSAPAIASGSATTFTTGTSGSFTVQTTGFPTPSVSETGTLPSGVTFVDNGNGTATLSGTPGANSGGSYPITITAANGVAPDATQSFTLTVDQAPAISSGSATTFTTGTSGSFTVQTTGFPPSSLSETGSLPSGVSFVDNGNDTATLSGTPAAGTGGTYPLTITASNGVAPDATQSFTLTVDQAPAITSANAATFVTGTAGSFTVQTTGFPTSAISKTGALPTGVTLVDNHDGTATLSGTPAANTTGTYTITITAANGVAPNATQSFTLTVDAAPVITSGSSTTFTVATAGSYTVQTTAFPTASISESGALPSGVSFVDNGNGTATLSGTPAGGTQGSYPLTITASNGVAPDATQSFTLTVTAFTAPPSITSRAFTTFTTGTAGSFTVQTTGAPTPSVSESGALPSGVTFVDNGDGTATLSGTAAPGTAGTYPLTITAANGVGWNAQSFTLTVNAPSAITSADATTFLTTTAGSFTVHTTGSPTPSISATGTLPSGVTFVDNGDGTATLSGTPAAGTGGTYPLTITASNGVGSNATQSFTLTVNARPAITSGSSTTFTTTTAGSFTVQSTGFPTPAVSETGALPSGVTFVDNHDGTATLSGTPAANSAGTYPLTITASNGVGSNATQSFTLTVDAVPAITSADSVQFTTTTAGSFTVQSTGYPTPAVSETGALPSGVTFVDNGDGTATLSGTPADGSQGSYPLTITASNGVAPNATQSFTLTVVPFSQSPVISSASSTNFLVSSAGSFTVQTSGIPTPSVSETGALPSGVTFVDNGDGTATLSGTPAAGTSGAYPLTITAANGVGSNATQSFTLNVDQAPAITSGDATTFIVGSAGSFSVTTTGFPAPAITRAGGLPSGVTFTDNSDGTATLAGTPATGSGGTYHLTLRADNGVGSAVTQNVTLTVDATAPVAFTGKMDCTATVQVTFTPELTESSSSTVTFTFTEGKCHGLNGTSLKQGTAKLAKGAATFTLPTGGPPGTYNCPTLLGDLSTPPAVTFSNTWAAKHGVIAPTEIALPTGTATSTKQGTVLSYPNGTVASGSFANGGAGLASLQLIINNKTIAALTAACNGGGIGGLSLGAPSKGNLILGS